MFFYLTDSLIVTPEHAEFNHIKRAVRFLTEQVFNSQHMLMGTYRVIEHFRKIFSTDIDICYPVFNNLFQNYATTVIPQCLTTYIEVVLDNPLTRIEGTVEIRQIKYDFIQGSNDIIKAEIIGEDFFDCTLFQYILVWYKKEIKTLLHTAIEDVHGGGVRMAEVIRHELDKKRWTIAFCDTDRNYPNCPIKKDSTCYNCQQLNRKDANYCFQTIEVQEIENLIPLNWIDMFDEWSNVNSEDAKRKQAFDYLRKNADKILPYFDYKKGIKKSNDVTTKQEFYNFAQLCYEQNDDYMLNEKDFGIFYSRLTDQDVVYPLLFGGTGTIKRTLKIIQDQSTCPIPVLQNFQKLIWNNIGQVMLNWSVCRNAEAIN